MLIWLAAYLMQVSGVMEPDFRVSRTVGRRDVEMKGLVGGIDGRSWVMVCSTMF